MDRALNQLGALDDADVRRVLVQLIRLGLDIVGADQGSLLTVEPGGKDLRFVMVASREGLRNAGEMSESLIGQTLPIGEGVTGMAALTHDIQAESRTGSGRIRSMRGDGSPNAVLAAPMLIGDELIGVITAVGFQRKKPFSTAECRSYGAFADVAAVVVDRQRRLDELASRGTGSRRESAECVLVRKLLELVRTSPRKAEAVDMMLDAMAKA